jgi:hypothetical protein
VAVISLVLGLAGPAAADKLRPTSDLDGNYVEIGPLGTLVHVADEWDGGFGGEIAVLRVREHAPLSAIGLGLGAMRFAKADNGRLWADVMVANRPLLGTLVGVSGGVALEIDDVVPPRWGAQGTLWIFAGIVPYLRIGSIQKTGIFIDLGIKVALPAFRW